MSKKKPAWIPDNDAGTEHVYPPDETRVDVEVITSAGVAIRGFGSARRGETLSLPKSLAAKMLDEHPDKVQAVKIARSTEKGATSPAKEEKDES